MPTKPPMKLAYPRSSTIGNPGYSQFKQIIGRGTRLFDGKDYFTIYDFVKAYLHFNDSEWDGEPLEPEEASNAYRGTRTYDKPSGVEEASEGERSQKLVIKLADGKERQIQHMTATNFYGLDGRLLSVKQFLEALYDTLKLPEFLHSEEHLREIWSSPTTRVALLEKLADAGFSRHDLNTIQELIDARNSDLFDVLEYVAYAKPTMTRKERVEASRKRIYEALDPEQREFVDFVLSQYVDLGVDELQQDRLPRLLAIKYHTQIEGIESLGGTDKVINTFLGFQKELYKEDVQRSAN